MAAIVFIELEPFFSIIIQNQLLLNYSFASQVSAISSSGLLDMVNLEII
jgi:hypothetical protein